ncbi:ESX secretion-associated protein EspG [Rhodococcoides kyotonense]|uniref:EspG family protein n=1 Tax=Rhodococcoides kyotonense TaxID=398843 RepID=A0A239KH72_9NOCA|nr:ESX secretion-associated protein EspG [Rhodococcus kyotonensis]SNT16969.1 EspG family protein [Rhodococcus kyotonensis]
MIERQWRFRGLEFRSLMHIVGRDRLPFPLQFRPDAVSADQYARQRREADVLARSAVDDDLRISLRAIAEPSYRIEVVGHRRRRDGQVVKVRAHAAVRHDVGVVLVQEPGVDDATGGDIAVTLVDGHRAIDRVVRALPSRAAGTTPRIDVAQSQTSGGTMIRAAAGTSSRERADRLLSGPQSSAGEILICPGASVDGRPDASTSGFHWIDIDGDGRYVVRHGSTVSILPAGPSDLDTEIRREVRSMSLL